MAKRRQEEPDEGSPAWMSTFSDLMNLLLCFFVLLFASSTMDAGKIQQIAASFQNVSFTIFNQTSQMIQDGQMVSGGITQLEGIKSIMTEVGKATDSTDGDDSKAEDNEGKNPDSTEVGQSNGTSTSETSSTESASLEHMQEQLEEAGLEQSKEMYQEISADMESYTIDERVQIPVMQS